VTILQEGELPTQRPAWARVVDGLAAMFGIASAIAGIGAILAIPFGIALQLTEDHVRVQTRIHELTSFHQAAYLAVVIGLVAVPGTIGLWLARRGRRSVERVSLVAMAARLSILGLACDGLILTTLLALLAYRWMR
jgi:nitrate reductase gamma subunit